MCPISRTNSARRPARVARARLSAGTRAQKGWRTGKLTANGVPSHPGNRAGNQRALQASLYSRYRQCWASPSSRKWLGLLGVDPVMVVCKRYQDGYSTCRDAGKGWANYFHQAQRPSQRLHPARQDKLFSRTKHTRTGVGQWHTEHTGVVGAWRQGCREPWQGGCLV